MDEARLRALLGPDEPRWPDLLVRGAAGEPTLVVEVEDAHSAAEDRLTKPASYAAAGIPSMWRVETDGADVPVVVAHARFSGRYEQVAVAGPGQRLRVHQPFDLDLAVDELAVDHLTTDHLTTEDR